MLDKFKIQPVVWDFANARLFEKALANSGDNNGRALEVRVMNGEEKVSLTDSTLHLAWKHQVNRTKGIDQFEVVDAENGLFRIDYTTGMLSNHGKLEASLVLIYSNGRIESQSFPLIVRESVVTDESLQSENSFSTFTAALVKVEQLIVSNSEVENGLRTLEEEFEQEQIERQAQFEQEQIDRQAQFEQEDLQGPQGEAGQGIVNQRTQTEMQLWHGTQAEYDSLIPDNNTLYFIEG